MTKVQFSSFPYKESETKKFEISILQSQSKCQTIIFTWAKPKTIFFAYYSDMECQRLSFRVLPYLRIYFYNNVLCTFSSYLPTQIFAIFHLVIFFKFRKK